MRVKTFVSILAAVVLVAVMLTSATAQSPVSEFDTILADKIIVTDSTTAPDVTASDDVTAGDDLTVGGDAGVTGATTTGTLAVTGNASTGGTLSVNGNMAIGGLVNAPYASTVITNGTVLTPTETALALAPTVESTITLGAGTNGQIVILLNDSAQTIHLADSGTVKLSAAWSPGQNDTLGLWYVTAVGWVELFRSNN